MRNVRLIVQYDGTAYAGFQWQPDVPTVQGVLEAALSRCCDEPVRVHGAGRTDAGVHARGQVVNFHTQGSIPTECIPLALGSLLPPDIVVVGADEVALDFHARFQARAKVYSYTFWRAPFPSPFWRRYSLHVPGELNVGAMTEAASLMEGRHDFGAFQGTGSSVRSGERTVHYCRVVPGVGAGGLPGALGGAPPGVHGDALPGEALFLLVQADGFLYHMVRVMAGTLLEVGRGRMPIAQVREALATGKRTLAGPTLPPYGLCLEQVLY